MATLLIWKRRGGRCWSCVIRGWVAHMFLAFCLCFCSHGPAVWGVKSMWDAFWGNNVLPFYSGTTLEMETVWCDSWILSETGNNMAQPQCSVANGSNHHTCQTLSKLALTISTLTARPNGKVEIIETVFIYNITACFKWINTWSTAKCKNATSMTVVPVTVLNHGTDSLFPRFWLPWKVWALQIFMNEGFLTSSKRSSCYFWVKTHSKPTKSKITQKTNVSHGLNCGNTISASKSANLWIVLPWFVPHDTFIFHVILIS